MFEFAAVDGVAAVVAGAVLDVGDGGADGGRVEFCLCGNYVDKALQEVDIGPLVLAADVVFFARCSLVDDRPDGGVVVFDKEPVADIFAVAVYGQRFTVEHVEYHERDEFFGEVVGAVVVGAVGEGYREAVGVVVGEHEVVA